MYWFIKTRVQALWRPKKRFYEERYAEVNGKRWPTFITGEDTISIKVLMDYDSPEWRWLRLMYHQLNEAVVKDKARLVVLQLPLAYQLEKGYPYIPQKLMSQFCEESSILGLDVLPTLRQYKTEEVFILKLYGDYDVWHLTEKGHQIVATELQNYLIGHKLLGNSSGKKG